MKRKFFYKIFLFIFASCLASIALLSSLIYFKIKEDNYQIAYNQARNNQREFCEQLHQIIDEYEQNALLWSQNNQVLELIHNQDYQSQDEIYNIVYSDLAQRMFRAEVTILDREHNVYIATDETIASQYQITSDSWGIFRKVREKGKTTYIPQQTAASIDRSIALSLAIPILDSGELSGYIMIDFPHQLFNEMYRSSAVPYNIDLILTDENFFSLYNSRTLFQENTFLSDSFKLGFTPRTQGIEEKRTDKELYLRQEIPDYQLKIFSIVPFEPLDNLTRNLTQSLWIYLMILLFVSGVISYLLALSLYRPIDMIMQNMKKVENGDLNAIFYIPQNNEMSTIAGQFNNMMSTIRTLIKTNEEKQQAIRQAEIKTLQSQMKPHFLYNVLNSITFMAKLNGVPKIAEMVTSLATLLRTSIATEKEIETIQESVELVENYLKIQSFRFEDDLEYEIYVDERIKDCTIPKLIIQPLIENAIEHGFEEIEGKGKVFLTIVLINEVIFISVEDNGKGIDPAIAATFKYGDFTNGYRTKGNGIGLKNIYERLTYYYGDHFRMEFTHTGGTSVFIEIPNKELDRNV